MTAPQLLRGVESSAYHADELPGSPRLSRCAVGSKDLSAWMVRAGWAVAFRKYSTAYVALEDEARLAHRGIWAGSFVVPELWRKGVR